jgi:penicillin-binding protein 2
MTAEDERFKIYSRRAALLVGGQACLLATLVGRMVYLQVIESKQYEMLAEENRISVRLVAPQRGKILDRFGVPLATNRPDYRVLIVPEQLDDITQTLDALGKNIALTDADFERVLKSAKRQRTFLPISVKDNLTWDEFARVNVESPELPGVQPDVGSTRHYPFSQLAAHLIGYVGAVTEKELDEDDDALLQLPDFKTGKNGVEKSYDTELRGKAGNTKVEVNALGRVIRELSRDEGTAGQDINLSVDAAIQKFAGERLGEESGSVVVIDILTGEIIAMASNPAYDPNQFNVGITHDQWKSLVEDPRKPLINKPVSGTYPPGSTFKPMVALAALESGVVNADHKVNCTGKVAFGNRLFHCWKEHGHGTLDMVGAIEHSCDIYFYDIAQRVGVDGIAEMANRFGLGQISGTELAGEKAGLIPTTAWKRKVYRQPWHPGETLSVAIGQGYVTATPLQLAVMAARIANGGKGVGPRFLPVSAAQSEASGEALPSLKIAPESMDIVHQGMTKVANDPSGTAFAARILDPAYAMAGKSGTSQVRRITMAQRAAGLTKNEDLPWVQRDHALFIAFGPVDAPRYAISVVLEHGGGGSKNAAPIARDVLYETMKRNPSRGGPLPSAAPVVTPDQNQTEPDQQNPDAPPTDDVPPLPDTLPGPVTPAAPATPPRNT